MILLFEQAVQLWESEISETTTITQYRGKIRKYLRSNPSMTIEEALNENSMFYFIFSSDGQSARGKYNALYNVYKYINEKIMGKIDVDFPINLKDVTEFDNRENYETKRNSYATVFLDEGFDFKELLNDAYYNHLNDEKAIITAKAIISMALATGLGKGELLKDISNSSYLKINHVEVIEKSQIRINIKGKNIRNIIIPIDSSQYIVEYMNLRKNITSRDDCFFIKLWDGRNLKFDDRIVNRKPSDLINLVLYVLKYISKSLGIDELKINDLRSNKIYHELIITKGSALNEIIKLHGYVPFVEEVFQKFISKYNTETCIGFDFFNKASSLSQLKDIYLESSESDIGDEALPETFMSLTERKRRNRKIVKELKSLYENKCQICGEIIDIGNGIKYSEVHHIHPIGSEHKGVDNKHNMIVLCPNHHKMFDLGILAIDPADCRSIVHIDKKNSLNGIKIEFKHIVAETNFRYHYDHIFLQLANELKSR